MVLINTKNDDQVLEVWRPAGTASTEPVRESAESSFYPNPAVDHVTVLASSGPTQMVLFDVLGREVLSIEGLVQGTNTIDLGGLSAGIYIARLVYPTGLKRTTPLVIQR